MSSEVAAAKSTPPEPNGSAPLSMDQLAQELANLPEEEEQVGESEATEETEADVQESQEESQDQESQEESQEESEADPTPDPKLEASFQAKFAKLQHSYQRLEAEVVAQRQDRDRSVARVQELEEALKSPFTALRAAGTSWEELLRKVHAKEIEAPKNDVSTLPKEVQDVLREHRELKAAREAEKRQQEFQEARQADIRVVTDEVIPAAQAEFPLLTAIPAIAEHIVNRFYGEREQNPSADAHGLLNKVMQTMNNTLLAQTKAVIQNAAAREILLKDKDLADLLAVAGKDKPAATEQKTAKPSLGKTAAGKVASGNPPKPTTLTNTFQQVPSRPARTQLSVEELAAEFNK